MKVQILTILVSMTTVLACHKGVDRIEVPADPSVTPAKFVSTCDSKTNSFRAKTGLVEEASSIVNIERQFQRIIVKDCAGSVTSNSIQTIVSPRNDVDLKPERDLSRRAKSVRLFNSETCDDDSQTLPSSRLNVFNNFVSITGNDNGSIRVKMDMAEAWSTFKVTSGWNHIYYTYSDNEEIASGVYNVYVNYTEKTLPGEVIREAQDCGKPK